MWLPLNTKIQTKTHQETELKGKVQDGEPLKNQVASLQSEDTKLTEILEQNKLLHGDKALNKEDFLTFLTDECIQNNTDLIKFNDLGTTEDLGKWKAQFDFELRGTLSALNNVCQAIDKIDIRYSIGGFSLRQNGEHEYLSRYFDNNTRLEWYKDDVTELEEPTTQENNSEHFEIPPETPVVPSLPEIESPAILPPVETPEQLPQPSQPSTDETITDRLDSLLKQTSTGYGPYGIMFLTNVQSVYPKLATSLYGENMLLNITIEFTMYANPKDFTNSFLTHIMVEV
jgi:hypothetical protein